VEMNGRGSDPGHVEIESVAGRSDGHAWDQQKREPGIRRWRLPAPCTNELEIIGAQDEKGDGPDGRQKVKIGSINSGRFI